MRYPFLLFDMDGTLVDFPAAERQSIRLTLASCGVCVTQAHLDAYAEANAGVWRELEKGTITYEALPLERFRRFCIKTGVTADPARLSDGYMNALARAVFLLPNALETIRALHAAGCRMVLVTNGISTVQHQKWLRTPLWPYVEGVIVSQDIGLSKPDARVAQRALDYLGCRDASQALFIGDSINADIACAQNAGIASCLYAPLPKPSPATYTIADLAQLPGIVLDHA